MTGNEGLDAALRCTLREAVLEGRTAQAEHITHLLLHRGCPLPELYSEVLQAVLDEVGRAWRHGEMSIAGVHVAAGVVRHVVTRLTAIRHRTSRVKGDVILMPVAGEQHVLGLGMVAHALAEDGWAVHLTDALPLSEVPAFAARFPDVRVLGLTLHDVAAADPLRVELQELRRVLPGVRVVLGGLAVRRFPGLAERLGADGEAADVRTGLRLLEELTNPLSVQERRVLELAAAGRSNGDIAAELGLGVSTVKTYLERIYLKVGVGDRTGSVATALRRDWIR